MQKKETKTTKNIKILDIIPFRRGPWGSSLTYFTSQKIKLEDILEISIKNKNFLGIVTNIKNIKDIKSEIKEKKFQLKKIKEKKEKNIFSKNFIKSIFLLSDYLLLEKNTLLDEITPICLTENYNLINEIIKKDKQTEKNKINTIPSEKFLYQENFDSRIDYYKTLIRSSFAKNESIFIILPTVEDIQNFEKKLNKGIENFIFSFHNKLGEKNILKKIENIYTQNHPVCIISTVPYLALPIKNLSMIILEKENRNAYIHIKKNIDLRIFVEIFSSLNKIQLIFADDILRFESIAQKKINNFGIIRNLNFRFGEKNKIEIIDKKEEKEKNKKNNLFSKKSLEEIKNNLIENKNIFIFALKKGLASKTICADCQEEVLCKNCHNPLALYMSKNKEKRIFFCGKCNKINETNILCDYCKSWNLKSFGVGIDTLFEELSRTFGSEKIIQFDKNTIINNKNAHKTINKFLTNKGNILLGTEMTFFYLKEKVPNTIITSVDPLWNIPNFKMNEKIIQIIINCINITKEKIIIETYNKDNDIINSFTKKNLHNFIKKELKERETLNYPPFTNLIKIKFIAEKEKIENKKQIMQDLFQKEKKDIFVNYFKDKMFCLNCILKIDKERWGLKELSEYGKIEKELNNKLNLLKKDCLVEINPENIL